MRPLLPAGIALLLALWWAVLPINFETLYEVHLCSVLPILAALYVAARWDTPIGRGVVLPFSSEQLSSSAGPNTIASWLGAVVMMPGVPVTSHKKILFAIKGLI